MAIDGVMIEQAKLVELKRIADALEEGVKLLTLFRNAYIPVSDDAFSDLFTMEPHAPGSTR